MEDSKQRLRDRGITPLSDVEVEMTAYPDSAGNWVSIFSAYLKGELRPILGIVSDKPVEFNGNLLDVKIFEGTMMSAEECRVFLANIHEG